MTCLGSEYEKIEVLAARISTARYSTGGQVTNNWMLGGEGII